MAIPMFRRHHHDDEHGGGERRAWPGPASQAGTSAESDRRLWTDLWGVVVFFGAACVILGIIVVAWPAVTVKIVAVVFGIQLLIMGGYRLIHAFTSPDTAGGTRTLRAVTGVLALIVGVLCLRHILETVAVLALILGLFWLIGGVVEMFHALSDRGAYDRGLSIASGALSTIAGLVVLAWPGVSVLALAVVLGIWLIVFGIMTVTGGYRLHRS